MLSSRKNILENLNGRVTDTVPSLLFTWEFDYSAKAAGFIPWEVCSGGDKWLTVYEKLYELHKPDAMLFCHSASAADGVVTELISENDEMWSFRHIPTNVIYDMLKSSLSIVGVHQPEDAPPAAPAASLDTIEDIDKNIGVGNGWGETYQRKLRQMIERFEGRAIIIPYHCTSYIAACYTYGFERSMEMIIDTPEIFQHLVDRYNLGLDAMMQTWKDAGAEVVFIADSWGGCDVISPKIFEEFVLPSQNACCDAAHRHGLKIIMYNPGNILPILQQQATVRCDGFAFEQPRGGVDLSIDKVRAAFGERCIFGNVDCEGLLITGSIDEIKSEVARQIKLADKKPFILNCGSPIPNNAPVEKVVAMYTADRSWG